MNLLDFRHQFLSLLSLLLQLGCVSLDGSDPCLDWWWFGLLFQVGSCGWRCFLRLDGRWCGVLRLFLGGIGWLWEGATGCQVGLWVRFLKWMLGGAVRNQIAIGCHIILDRIVGLFIGSHVMDIRLLFILYLNHCSVTLLLNQVLCLVFSLLRLTAFCSRIALFTIQLFSLFFLYLFTILFLEFFYFLFCFL